MENSNDFLKDWLEGKVTPAELNSRKENADPLVRDYEELISRSAGMKVPDKTTTEEAWENFLATLDKPQPKEAKVVKMNRWIPLSIAASVSLLVIAFFVFNKVSISTQLAETKVYVLPDGSEVTLNADSKITFSRFGWLGDRSLTLQGEAFFDVKKGSIFAVNTDRGSVTVLGTSFNVNARVTAFAVACYSGKVKVNSGESNIILTKGLSTSLINSALTSPISFNAERTTWRDGDFYFEAQPLGDVIDEIERQFNVEIVYTGNASRLYTGYFNKGNLDDALAMVFKPMSLKYERQSNNKIIVK
ncbi:MAG TPA: FecR domain-containing protein [Chryseosolibacter sp.]|nr:FecR domain-containing protein [Chryseosolibacter sp.]